MISWMPNCSVSTPSIGASGLKLRVIRFDLAPTPALSRNKGRNREREMHGGALTIYCRSELG
jgi:hypothetical protein